jgi:hypothetical protein
MNKIWNRITDIFFWGDTRLTVDPKLSPQGFWYIFMFLKSYTVYEETEMMYFIVVFSQFQVYNFKNA